MCVPDTCINVYSTVACTLSAVFSGFCMCDMFLRVNTFCWVPDGRC